MKYTYNRDKTRSFVLKQKPKGDFSWSYIVSENILQLVAYLGSYDSFSVLVLREVGEILAMPPSSRNTIRPLR